MSKPLRVLVTEDDPIVSHLFRRMLERLGHEARFAATGREAISVTRREELDVILLDLHLPDLDGSDTAREIIADAASAPPRIIGMTGGATDEEERRAIEAGIETVLTKPVGMDELSRCLEA